MIDQIGVNGVYKYLPIAQNANSMMFIVHKLVTARALAAGEPIKGTTARIIPLEYRRFRPDPPRFLVCNDEEFSWLCDVVNGDVDFLSLCDVKELSIYDQAD